MQLLQLGAHLHAELRVQVRQRLVQQEHLRLAHQRPAHRHALALAAGELARPALQQVVEAEHRRHRADALRDLVLRGVLRWRSPNARFFSTVMCGYSA